MSVYNKRGILLLPKVIVLNPKDGSLLNDILRDHPELKEKKGTLELDGYSDTGNDGAIPFKLK